MQYLVHDTIAANPEFLVHGTPAVVRAANLPGGMAIEMAVGIGDDVRWVPLVINGRPLFVGGEVTSLVMSLPGRYRVAGTAPAGAVVVLEDYKELEDTTRMEVVA